MLGIILVIMAIVYLRKRGKVKGLNCGQFASVPPAEFERWRALEIKSIDIFVWTILGTNVVGGILWVIARASSSEAFSLVFSYRWQVCWSVLWRPQSQAHAHRP